MKSPRDNTLTYREPPQLLEVMIGLTHQNKPKPVGRGSINLGGMQSPAHHSRNPYGKGIDYQASANRQTHRLPSVTGMGAQGLGGGQSPLHFARNPYGKGIQYGGYAPKPGKPQSLTQALGLPDMPSFNMPNFSGGGMFDEPPMPTNTHVDSSIAPIFDDVQKNFLPENVVRTGINQQFADLQRQANPQTMLEGYGATGSNMASAASGQHQPLMMAQMAEPYQQAAMLQGEGPLQAAQQRYELGTKGFGAQSQEVQGLHNQANDWYRDRLQNWNRLHGQQTQAANMIFGRRR